MDDKMLEQLEDLLASVSGNQKFYEQAQAITNPDTKLAFMMKFEEVQKNNADIAGKLLMDVFQLRNETRIEKLVKWLKTH